MLLLSAYRISVNSSFYLNYLLIALFMLYVACVLNTFGAFSRVKTSIQTFKEDQRVVLNHKKVELYMFHLQEKTCLLLTLYFFVLPGVLEMPGYLVLTNSEFLNSVKIYIYSLIIISGLVNSIIIFTFNPGVTGPKAQFCINCANPRLCSGGGGGCQPPTPGLWRRNRYGAWRS